MTETKKNLERITKETEREKLIAGGNFNARISSELSTSQEEVDGRH